MKKLDLNSVAREFDIIDSQTHLFYNTETGEFDYYMDFMDSENNDYEKFEEDCWISAPRQSDIGEYDMMVEFAETVTDQRANKLLCSAIVGKGAFRRFKDTLDRVGLRDEWYDFKHNAYVNLAREWCEENDIPYESTAPNAKQTQPVDNKRSLNIAVIPLLAKAAGDAAEVLRDALNYSKSNAEETIRSMMKKSRIAFAAIADGRVIGIIGAIPQYGITGWELHPLAVLNEYQRRGVGTALIGALEREVAERGGVMLYLGSDDETGTTSLYGADLYEDTFNKLTNIQNINGHPYPFYEKLGYKIVGVFPDANGIGKPDIWMAKRIMKV